VSDVTWHGTVGTWLRCGVPKSRAPYVITHCMKKPPIDEIDQSDNLTPYN
jgi:hypothetical protein